MADPPEAGTVAIGELRARFEGRRLVLEGTPRPLRLTAAAGPAPSEASLRGHLAAGSPSLVVVIGGLGDRAPLAARRLVVLAELEVPVLLVAGGRDRPSVWAEAWELAEERLSDKGDDGTAALARVIDAGPLEAIRVGGDELIPLAGAPAGRYAVADDACGFGPEDLERRAEALGEPPDGRRRWLVSWATPAVPGLADGFGGAEAADSGLAAFMKRVGATGGLFAWPRTAAGRAVTGSGAAAAGPTDDLRVVLPPASGVTSERPDGRRIPPGVTRLELGSKGLQIKGLAGSGLP
jgi:hypothetical protein